MAEAYRRGEAAAETEKKIPVFTVLKNNSILKNIFLIGDHPPSISGSKASIFQENEDILVVGRHPDCNITLEHPSISRYHLRIHSIPSSQSLSVLDLSSIHGTWVSGKKIEPRVNVQLNEGDTLQLGGSSRVYRLHWVPLSRAYDLDNPFVPPLDASLLDEENEVDVHQVTKCSTIKNLNAELEVLDSFVSDENMEPYQKEKIRTSALPMVGNMNSSSYNTEEVQNGSPQDHEWGQNSCLEHQLSKEKDTSLAPLETAVCPTGNPESPLTVSKQTPVLPSIWSRRGKVASVQIQTEKSKGKGSRLDVDAEMEPLKQTNIRNESISKALFAGNDDEEETFTPDKENLTAGKLVLRSMKKTGSFEETRYSRLCTSSLTKNPNKCSSQQFSSEKEKVQSQIGDKEKSSPGVNIDIIFDSGNQENTENRSILKALPATVDESEEAFILDKENSTPNTVLFMSIKKMTPLKEVQQLSKSYSSSTLSIDDINCCSHQQEDVLAALYRENQTTKVFEGSKSRSSGVKSQAKLEAKVIVMKSRAERVPFQSLLVNADDISKSDACFVDPTTNSKSVISFCQTLSHPFSNNAQRREKESWTMVADTNCLLDQDSRKALQLLQGLKGTHLIIPRIVIRELDCIKRRGSLFRSTTEACLALRWIESCMLDTKWWIHVQNSSEEGRLIAPTPPDSPQYQSSKESGGFQLGPVQFSPKWSFLENMSPTAKDNVLECALFFRRINFDRRLVLLSDDITLKIKAMAEGLLCETAEEFRRSLVNPFSERFMWADSSPRGPTWSCVDDMVLKEKYYPCPWKKLTKFGEGVRGLKLILLHDSQYRQISSLS